MHIALEPFDSDDGQALRDELGEELIERYGYDSDPGIVPKVETITAFFIARDDEGNAIGCGALRSLGQPVAEIKRMYTRPEARGKGVGACILQSLEDEARRQGFAVLRLETGPLQPEAVGLYERSGYRPIPCFGPYAGAEQSRCFERRL